MSANQDVDVSTSSFSPSIRPYHFQVMHFIGEDLRIKDALESLKNSSDFISGNPLSELIEIFESNGYVFGDEIRSLF